MTKLMVLIGTILFLYIIISGLVAIIRKYWLDRQILRNESYEVDQKNTEVSGDIVGRNSKGDKE